MATENEKKAVHPVQIFKSAFALWSNNLVALAGIYLVVLPVLIARVVFAVAIGQPSAPGAGFIGLVFLGLIVSVAEFGLASWATIALIQAAAKMFDGAKVSIAESLRQARSAFWRYVGASFLYMLVIFAIGFIGMLLTLALAGAVAAAGKPAWGIVLFFLFGVPTLFAVVYFSIRWFLYGVASVTESLSPKDALRRSHELVSRRVNPSVGAFILFFLFAVLCAVPLMVFGAIARNPSPLTVTVNAVYQFVMNLLLVPLWVCVSVALFAAYKKARA